MINQQVVDYVKLSHERNNGRLFTPDSIHFICESYKYNAEKNGKHFFELMQ